MLSSRCNDAFSKDSEITLTDLRRELKKEIESVQLLGREIFEVWINEDAPPSEGNKDTCLKAVRECDVLIVLSNGNAGWALSSEDIGICHAEYMEGLRTAQSKVRFIELPKVANADDVNAQKRNQRYQEYVSKQTPFRGGEIKTVEDAKKVCF
ncbi:hypothetical protein A8139_07620 [Marinomonas primoryensis]|uniref:DUF4062 domain-containing protein n=1 Tax=Marinomonas primoryensis TaxID=178399 RepID=A0A2Z4PQL3_9GAMM|nr:DUF4062 domain-containing protein [Marinomonas primoryensis]AWX99877.1 hypothetical protein A8139_07620 [Marinomonas primoryensis]